MNLSQTKKLILLGSRSTLKTVFIANAVPSRHLKSISTGTSLREAAVPNIQVCEIQSFYECKHHVLNEISKLFTDYIINLFMCLGFWGFGVLGFWV